MYDLCLFLFALVSSPALWAQNVSPQPATPTAPALKSPAMAYETATLPKDRVQAWEMLRAASGLGDETLQPWYLHMRYKTYDAYGKAQGEGTLEFVWAGPKKWRKTFTEGTTTWTMWRTENGLYKPHGQTSSLSYAASLILAQYLHPLGGDEASQKAPPYFAKEPFSTTTLSCFSTAPQVDLALHADAFYRKESENSTDLKRACTVPDKPFLLVRQGDYTVFFEQNVSFQHQIVAKHILIKDGAEAVADVDLDLLRTPDVEQMSSMEPPSDAILLPGDATQGSVIPSHPVKKVAPRYPEAAKQRGIQGNVRLSAMIGLDGKVKDLELLHSPSPDLATAAMEAVKQWVYTPCLLNGKPVKLTTQVHITFIRP